MNGSQGGCRMNQFQSGAHRNMLIRVILLSKNKKVQEVEKW
jgi:hypothetical protein